MLRPGPAARALPELLRETGASAVYANAEIGPYPERRDREAGDAIAAAGARLRLFPDALLVEPDALTTAAGDPYTVYTPFSRKWRSAEKRDPEPPPAALESSELSVRERSCGTRESLAFPPRGPASVSFRSEGWRARSPRAAARFLEGPSAPIARYAGDRNRPDRAGTSRLSPHLRFGTISTAGSSGGGGNGMAGLGPAGARRTSRHFVVELAWREFYASIVLFHFPRVSEESFRPEYKGSCRGRAGPRAPGRVEARRDRLSVVDAGMRELWTTGWMHNRVRMVVASFLTKDPPRGLAARRGVVRARLADADLANNNGGWQWVAGCGTDAAPFFRIFSPVLQASGSTPTAPTSGAGSPSSPACPRRESMSPGP